MWSRGLYVLKACELVSLLVFLLSLRVRPSLMDSYYFKLSQSLQIHSNNTIVLLGRLNIY